MIGSSVLLLATIALIDAATLSINNGVKGQPNISCGTRTVSVTIETEKQFFGSIYVKGFFNNPGCRVKGNSTTKMTIDVPVQSTCGMRRRRMANPRGLVVDTTIVLMFHPIFMTQVDKAYHIQCNYMESNKEVTQALDVSMQAPTELPQSDGLLGDRKAPICRYEVLTKDKNGSPVMFATIGDLVYHKWTCESDDNLQYCMTVHSCTADDGQGIGQQLIDENGCSLDNFLLKNLDYSDDLVAGQVAHVFKFADKPTIFFSCMVRLEVKEDVNSKCKHSLDHCAAPSHRSLPIQTPNRVDKLEASDFPKPPPMVDQGKNGFEDTLAETNDEEYQFIRSQRDTQHALDLDVLAPSVEVVDLPEVDTNMEKRETDLISPREVEVCLSRLSIGLGLCSVLLLAATSICFYLALSMRKRKEWQRPHPQPVPHPGLS